MKLALYKYIGMEFTAVHEVNEYTESDEERVRVSEIIEVEFKNLPYGEAEKKEIAVIDKQITRVMAVSEAKINELKQRKDDLLALSN